MLQSPRTPFLHIGNSATSHLITSFTVSSRQDRALQLGEFPGMSSSASRTSSARKRARTEDTSDQTPQDSNYLGRADSNGDGDDAEGCENVPSHATVNEGTASNNRPRPRLRAAIACSTCRARKTKCNGVRPSCGYCTKIKSVCHYDGYEDYVPQLPLSCQNIGHDVLKAIEYLTKIVQQQQVASYTPHLPHDAQTWSSSPGQVTLAGQSDTSPRHVSTDQHEYEDTGTSAHHPAASEGLDSILTWAAFPDWLPVIPVDDGKPLYLADALPPLASSYLQKLETNYILIVHTKNPMLNLATLHGYVAHVAENGFDWSTRSCLVAIVCAIGALCLPRDPSGTCPDGGSRVDVEENEDNAYRFWSLGSKRLGLAMSQNNIEAAQCLCLSGIWFMCCLRPLQAWKHFTMAGNTWYSSMIARSPNGSLDVQLQQLRLESLEQSVFYTAYKSELEIRYELGMHGSVLEHIEDRILYPSPPPNQDAIDGLLGQEEGNLSWYFYLSDIAARHLINRIVESRINAKPVRTVERVRRLFRDYDVFFAQLQEWYESLPPAVSFELPQSTVPFEPNSSAHILRSRYLFIHELLCRPFLRICLNPAVTFPDTIADRITNLASLGLQCCAWKLEGILDLARRDHGMWISVRNTTACAMMLIGAVRAKAMPDLHLSERLHVPENWRDLILTALSKYGSLANETGGGVAYCVEMVHHALADFSTGPDH